MFSTKLCIFTFSLLNLFFVTQNWILLFLPDKYCSDYKKKIIICEDIFLLLQYFLFAVKNNHDFNSKRLTEKCYSAKLLIG